MLKPVSERDWDILGDALRDQVQHLDDEIEDFDGNESRVDAYGAKEYVDWYQGLRDEAMTLLRAHWPSRVPEGW